MKGLRYKNPLRCLVVAMFLVSSPVFANDDARNDLDVTMRMVTDDEALTDSVVREIRLSKPIGLDQNRGAAADEIAKEAREQGREFGQEIANRAREAGRLRNEVGETPKPDRPDKPDKPDRPDLDIPESGKPETGNPQVDRAPAPVTP